MWTLCLHLLERIICSRKLWSHHYWSNCKFWRDSQNGRQWFLPSQFEMQTLQELVARAVILWTSLWLEELVLRWNEGKNPGRRSQHCIHLQPLIAVRSYLMTIVTLFQTSYSEQQNTPQCSSICAGAGTSSSTARWRLENKASCTNPRQSCERCLTRARPILYPSHLILYSHWEASDATAFLGFATNQAL